MLIHGATDNDLHPPLFGATQRSFGLFRGLARHHDVRVLCIVPNRTRKPREERVAEVTLLRRSASDQARITATTFGLARPWPSGTAWTCGTSPAPGIGAP